MSDFISRDQFAQQTKTKFALQLSAAESVELELAEVTEPVIQRGGTKSYEGFSLFFFGPKEKLLPQKSYELKHAVLGAMTMFLVPTGIDDRGAQYQAVFNRNIKPG